jgi:hypothetical protein
MTPEEQLRRAIEELTRALREETRTRASRPTSGPTTTTSAPTLPAGTSGTGVDFDANKVGEGVKKAAKEIGETFQSLSAAFDQFTSNLQNSFGNLISDVVNFRSELDRARVELVKQTGGMKEAISVYSEFSGYARGLGISFEDSARMMGELTQGIPGFLELTKQQSVEIAKEAALLSRLGVSAQDTAAVFTTLTKSFGQTTAEAKKTERSLVSFANALKQPPSIILKDFVQAIPKLGIFGSKAIDTFKNVEGVAKKLGVSIDEMLGQIDKFDTFESAADAAGKLNIVLGQNLFDTQELLFTADKPIERMEIFRSALEKIRNTTGETFETMDFAKKKDIIASSGLTVDTLNKLDKMDKKALMDASKTAKMGKDGLMTLEETAAKTLTLSDRLSAMKDKLLGAFLPLIEQLEPIIISVSKYLGMFTTFMGNLSKNYPGFMKIVTGMASAFAAYKALDSAGILGIFDKLKSGIASLIPFGNQLSGFVLPGIGAALAGFAAKYGSNSVDEFFKDSDGKASWLKGMLGLTPKQMKSLQADLDNIGNYVYDGLFSVLTGLGFDEVASSSIIGSMKKTLIDLYSVIEEQFGKIKKVFGSFFEGFSENMGSDEEKDPFVKIIRSINSGLKRALDELKKQFGDAGADGKSSGALGELSTTLTKFGNTFKDIFKNVFGDLFGGDGKPGFAEEILNSDFIKRFGGEIISTIGDIFSGIGDLFKFLTDSASKPNILTNAANTISTVITTIIDTLKGSVSVFGAGEAGTAAGFGIAAGGIGKLTNAINSLDTKAAQNFKTNVENLVSPIAQLSQASLAQINDPFIASFTRLAEAIKLVNQQILEFSKVKSELNFMAMTPPDQVEHLKSVVVLLERYSAVLSDINRSSKEEPQALKLMEKIGEMVGEFQIDSEKMGNVIGDKVANAIANRFSGG